MQRTFIPSLVPIGPVVSENKIKMLKFMNDDRQWTLSDDNTSQPFGSGELTKILVRDQSKEYSKLAWGQNI